jgi:disulfide bond formation protein DsbB
MNMLNTDFTRTKLHLITFCIGMAVSLIATTGSLYYSEVVGFTPCRLCWFQRIFTYPQVVIFFGGIYMSRRESFDPRTTYTYGLVFSAIAVLIASYHSYIQIDTSSIIGCSSGCSVVLHRAFGIFSIPNQSLIANVVVLITCICGILITMKEY